MLYLEGTKKAWKNFKCEEGFFLGYFTNSKAYRVYNNKTMSVMETISVVINDDGFTQKLLEVQKLEKDKDP